MESEPKKQPLDSRFLKVGADKDGNPIHIVDYTELMMAPRYSGNLPIAIFGAVVTYYNHRRSQHEKHWDRDYDLASICNAAKFNGWTVEAVAGTFWFSKPSPLGTVVVKVNENNYLTGGESNVGESLAKHPMLDWVMGKLGRK